MAAVIVSLLVSTVLAQSTAVLTTYARLAFIRRAHVWTPTEVRAVNIREGPAGPGAFQPGELVVCDYVERRMSGSSRKFYCAIRPDDVVKVRYGRENGEVEGSVLATRLLWALGFAADRVYPVRVRCRGCSSDPWNDRHAADQVHEFDPAAIERPPRGHEMHSAKHKSGWAWPELDLVDEHAGGAPVAQRDALTLLAVLMQHTDTKPEQQRLLCPAGALTTNGECATPFLILHDVGVTFGRANTFNRAGTGSVNFEQWARTPVWRDRQACIGHLSESHTGTLGDPRISEAGRRFLSDLLLQLTDSQLRDLFDVARVEFRSAARVSDWVGAFKDKRNDIATNHCPQ